jgi:hypothetical protein
MSCHPILGWHTGPTPTSWCQSRSNTCLYHNAKKGAPPAGGTPGVHGPGSIFILRGQGGRWVRGLRTA